MTRDVWRDAERDGERQGRREWDTFNRKGYIKRSKKIGLETDTRSAVRYIKEMDILSTGRCMHRKGYMKYKVKNDEKRIYETE